MESKSCRSKRTFQECVLDAGLPRKHPRSTKVDFHVSSVGPVDSIPIGAQGAGSHYSNPLSSGLSQIAHSTHPCQHSFLVTRGNNSNGQGHYGKCKRQPDESIAELRKASDGNDRFKMRCSSSHELTFIPQQQTREEGLNIKESGRLEAISPVRGVDRRPKLHETCFKNNCAPSGPVDDYSSAESQSQYRLGLRGLEHGGIGSDIIYCNGKDVSSSGTIRPEPSSQSSEMSSALVVYHAPDGAALSSEMFESSRRAKHDAASEAHRVQESFIRDLINDVQRPGGLLDRGGPAWAAGKVRGEFVKISSVLAANKEGDSDDEWAPESPRQRTAKVVPSVTVYDALRSAFPESATWITNSTRRENDEAIYEAKSHQVYHNKENSNDRNFDCRSTKLIPSGLMSDEFYGAHIDAVPSDVEMCAVALP